QLNEWEAAGGRGSCRADWLTARQEPRPPAGVLPAEWATTRALAAATRAQFNAAHPHRLLLVLARDKDPAAVPARARQLFDQHAGAASWHAPDGIAYGSGPP